MSDPAAALRWGIIGVGRFGRIHARTLRGIRGIELAAICNRNAEKLAAAAADLGVEAAFSDYRDVLADPSIDVVSITTHWQDHELAVAALQAGKHVLLEKPMAASTEQCLRIVQAARAARGKFMVAHICRFDPRVTLAKRAIEEGRIGRVVSMRAQRNLPKAPGSLRLDKTSPFMGDGVHDADLMMWLSSGLPTRVFARYLRVGDFKYPDAGWAMLEFGDQAVGIVETNWALPANTPTVIDAKLEVVGTDGMLTIDCSATGLTVIDSEGAKMRDTAYWPEQHGHLVGAIQNELSYFIHCVRNDESPDAITPLEAARAVSVMEAAEQSASSGQPVAYCDPY